MFLVSDNILLLFKHFIFISRDSNILSFSRFFRNPQKVYTIEQKNKRVRKKKKLFHTEWQTNRNKLYSFINACYINMRVGLGNTVKLLYFLFCPVIIMYILLVVFCLFLFNNYSFRVSSGGAVAECGVASGLTVKTTKQWQLKLFWCLYCWLWVYFVPCSGVRVVLSR